MSYWGSTKPPAGTPLDRGHALAAGLVAYWPLNEVAPGAVTDLVAGLRLVAGSSSVFRRGANGGTLLTQGSYYDGPPITGLMGRSAFTMMVWASAPSLGASNPCAFSVRNGTTDGSTVQIIPLDGTSTFLGLRYRVNGTQAGEAAQSRANGLPHQYVLTSDGTTLRGYADGVQVLSTTSSQTVSASITNTTLAATSPGVSAAVNGTGLYQAAAWARTLTAAEVARQFADPYGLLMPPLSRRAYFVFTPAPAGGGSARGSTLAIGMGIGI